MHRSAAVLCQDPASLQALRTVLAQMEIEPIACHSQQEALGQILTKQCAALVVDFDLPCATEVARVATLLEPSQRPAVMAMTRGWLSSGQAFQSGANRILYKPLDPLQVKDAFEIAGKTARRDARNAPRYTITSVLWLDLETGTLPAVAVNLSEHGMAIRTTERLRLQSNVSFRCSLPGSAQLHGYADVIWSDDAGCAGLFFSRLSPSAQKHLKEWLHRRAKMAHGRKKSGKLSRGRKTTAKPATHKWNEESGSVRDLLPPTLA